MFHFARRVRMEATRTFLGKLPRSLEFLRVNAATPEARLFDDWVQAALGSLAGSDWESRFDAMPKVAFWLNFAAAERTLVGALAPSRDAGGRRFPRAAFAAFDARSLERALAVSPLAFDASVASAARVIDAAAEARSTAEIAAALEDLPTIAAADDPLHRQELWQFLDTHTIGDLAAMLGRGTRVDRLVAALAEVLHPLRDTSPRRLTWAIALPLPTDPALRDLVAGSWLDLMDALLGRKAVRASHLMAGAGEAARFVVTFRDPSPRILASLVSGRLDPETILDLGAVAPPASYSYAGRTLLETAASADAPAARLVRAAESL